MQNSLQNFWKPQSQNRMFMLLITDNVWKTFYSFTYHCKCSPGDYFWKLTVTTQKSLREKWPNTEFFLLRIFLYLDWIQENTDQKKSVFGHFSRVTLRIQSEYKKILTRKNSVLGHFSLVNLRIQSEYRKIRTRKNSVFGHFSRSEQFI